MAHEMAVCAGVKLPHECKCYGAVMRTYQSMNDVPHNVAMDAAIRVYRHHHPEDSKHDASLTVERWISSDHVH